MSRPPAPNAASVVRDSGLETGTSKTEPAVSSTPKDPWRVVVAATGTTSPEVACDAEIVVLGAGISGLACARELEATIERVGAVLVSLMLTVCLTW